jgi:hypothetical protein
VPTLVQPKGCCSNCTTASSLVGQGKSCDPKNCGYKRKTSVDWLGKRIERIRMWKVAFELNIEGTKYRHD